MIGDAMRIRSFMGAALAVGLCLVLVSADPADAMSGQTEANLMTALGDEALAYAEYQIWADAADMTDADVAALFRDIADDEREDHFTQLAAAIGMVDRMITNLRTAIVTERAEWKEIYPQYADQARTDGDLPAASLFDALAADEKAHQALLTQIMHVIMIGCRWPALPSLDPVAVVPGPALSSGQSLLNVLTAMRTEAFDSARYLLFSRSAYAYGNSMVGMYLLRLSEIEFSKHFVMLANQAGLTGDLMANLGAAVGAENGAVSSYTAWEAQAVADGDTTVAAMFAAILADEVVHQDAFSAALGG